MPRGTSGSSVVVECWAVPQGKRVQGLARACFSFIFFSPSFLSFLFLWVSYRNIGTVQHQFIAPSPIKGTWQNNFSGPSTIILKAVFLCNNSTRNSLLIHGFWPVNAQLLIAYNTAFYAIMYLQTL